MSIRWRLTLSFGFVFGVAVAVAALFLFVAIQSWVVSVRIDTRLNVYSALKVSELSGETEDGIDYAIAVASLPSLGYYDPDHPDSTIWVQLADADGNVLARSNNLGDVVLPVISGRNLVPKTVSGGTLRILPYYFEANGQIYQLAFAQSLSSVNSDMARMGIALLLIVVAFVALAILSVAIMIGRALSPVKTVTATAQSIASSSDLSRRVNYHGPKDEIGQLAATFDQMIEQIDGLMRSQRSFVADASHELRGPLTVIRGNLDLLKRDLSEEDRSESIRVLEAEMARMTRIINDLLVLAEVESGQLDREQTVSLKEILLDAQDRALLMAKDRRIVIERQDDLWVKGDAHKLDQMIGNLVTNAVRYTPDGGTITLSLYRDGDWARVDVADTGIGIPAEQLPDIFERFYRVDKARSRRSGGSGLGLAIVKGIAEQHGGRVSVTSELGKGSTFSVWLSL
ncbi:MAG: HAMP domain-containing protein [Dehalococcoidia bacterium]|nr:HAMP domain-containing protein [Dehalococcoidia bacterium]